MEEDYPRTLLELERRFSTEQACREYLFDLRWPDGFRCPRCEAGKSWALQSGRVQCAGCGYQVSMTAGTVFQDTRTTLTEWFRAMWWLTSQKNGVSAVALHRVLGWGSYQTAWTCLHKLRRAMIRPGRERLAGVVEVDESYLGGDEHGVLGRHIAGKALVVVAAEEDGRAIGRIRLRHIPDASAARLIPFIEDSIEPGSIVHTDGWSGYLPLRTAAYQHRISKSKGPSGAGFRVTATRPSGLFATEAVVVGNAPGICRRGTSSGLSERIRVPLQPPQIAQPRQTLLPLGAAGRRNRTNNLQADCGLGHQTEIAQTQPVGGT
jgi:transposase-like protein